MIDLECEVGAQPEMPLEHLNASITLAQDQIGSTEIVHNQQAHDQNVSIAAQN